MSVDKTEAILKVDGRKLPLEVQQILSLTSSKEVNRIPRARIVIRDGEVDKQDFRISNQNHFVPGTRLEIILGTPKEKYTIFKGIVVKHSIQVRKDKPSVLIVECKDESVRLTVGRKSRFFNEISDSDLFQQIVDEYETLKLEGEDSAPAFVHNQIVQYFTTDWDFITMRAEPLGHYLFVSDGTIKIGQPQLDREPVFKLAYGVPFDSKERSRMWEFDSELESRNQFETITTTSWDYSKQAVVEGASTFTTQEAGNIKSDELTAVIGLADYKLHHLGRMLEDELNAFAGAVKQKSLLNKLCGRVKFDGRADVLPGDMIVLEGVGNRFNGKVFVSRVHHSFEPGRWFTEILFGLPYTWYHETQEVANPPALGLVPQIHGLQIGKVVQLKDDAEPDKDFRIKIRIPGFHSDEEGIWARLASMQAGGTHGLLFLPNIDDEVVVGYVGQDAREPIVLGSLYSESASPPFTNDDQNFVKGIVTNNNHRIVIDEEKNTVTVETSGGNKLVLDDGEAKIEISRGQSAIELTDTEIRLKANTIKFDALTTIDIKANGSANINSPSGGLVRLGQGVAPVAHVGNPVSLIAVLPGVNVKVFV